jgi:hypothetical protein
VPYGYAYRKANQYPYGDGFKIGSRILLNYIRLKQSLLQVTMSIYTPHLSFADSLKTNTALHLKKPRYIHNIDKKGTRITCPTGQEVVVPVGIKEMYVRIPENRISITVICHAKTPVRLGTRYAKLPLCI